MGRAGRVACIFTPYVLSIASLICIALVLSGGLDKHSSLLDSMYFFRTDLTGLYNSDVPNGNTTNEVALSNALQQIKDANRLDSFYDIYMWNFCSGNTAVADRSSVCSKAKPHWSFDLMEVWGLDGTGMNNTLPTELIEAVNVYNKVSQWNYYAYLFAGIATVLEVLVGISAIYSRWGSFATTIFSTLALTLTLGASITSIVFFASFVATFNDVFGPYNIYAHLGHNVYAVSWLGTFFAFNASVFWFFSICCCSGKSPYHKDADRKRGRGKAQIQRTPYSYERMPSPLLAQSGHHEQTHALLSVQRPEASSAYEPFRHHGP